MNIAAIILAAGGSTRMGGQNKLLLPFNGQPMIARVTVTVLEADYEPVLVVPGFAGDEIRNALAGLSVGFAHNKDWSDGMAGSIRTGLEAVRAAADGMLIVLADMPLLSATTLRLLKRQFAQSKGAKMVFPVYGTRQGNPVLMPAKFFPEIASLTGDRGCKVLLTRYGDESVAVPVETEDVIWDIDNETDYSKLISADKGGPLASS